MQKWHQGLSGESCHIQKTPNDMASPSNKLNVFPVTFRLALLLPLCTHLVVLHDVQDQLPQCVSRITAIFHAVADTSQNNDTIPHTVCML